MPSGRLTLFDSPLFLGFDHLEETFDRLRKSGSDGYPPYNIEQTGETKLRIALAVAGFSANDLDVEIDQTQLIVRGKQKDDKDRIFLHRGIAARQFQRAFVLADGIEIEGASLDNGLLHINLRQIVPERQVKKIKISSSEKNSEDNEAIDIQKIED